MEDLGYRRVRFNLSLSLSLQESTGELIVRHLSLVMPEAFEIGLSLHLDRVSSSLISLAARLEDEEYAQRFSEELGRVRIRGLKLLVEDLGIRERILEREAQRGNTPERILQTLSRELEEALKEDPAFREDLLKALEGFLLKGGAILVRADPVPPLDVQSLVLLGLLSFQGGDFSEFVYRMNLKVKRLQQPFSISDQPDA